MACTKRSIKILLWMLNGMFLLFGAALICFGVYFTYDHGNMTDIVGSTIYTTGAYVLVFSGALIMMVTFCGLIGSEKENRCLLITYIVILILLLLCTFVGGILVLAFKGSMNDASKSVMRSSLKNQYGRHRLATDAWNYTQTKLRCCAVDNGGWSDYMDSYWDKFTNADQNDRNSKILTTSSFYRFVPISCCWTLVDPLTGWPTSIYRDVKRCQNWQYGPPNFRSGAHNDAVFYRGCFDAVKDYLAFHANYIGGIGICTALLTLCGIILAIILLRKIPTK